MGTATRVGGKVIIDRRKTSTFSCDIAYSDSPAASRASARSAYSSISTINPSRTVITA